MLALTGGYRRTPFLQRGAGVWCDTALIARARPRQPGAAAVSGGQRAGAARLLAQWADSTLFWR